MKRLSILISALIILISCQPPYQPRTIESVVIKSFTIANTSIRAIQVIDSNSVAFAGSNGVIGIFSEEEKFPQAHFPIYQDSITPNFRSIAFNGKDYFALSIGNPALLYRLSEGETSLVYSENHKKVFYDSMHFFEDNVHAIAVGDPTENCASIIVTEDRGKSWRKLPCTSLPVFEEGEAFFAASNTNIKIKGSTVWIVSGGKKARILKSNDYGKTWKIYNTPIVQGKGPQGIYSIDFYDMNQGIIIGGDYSKPLENTSNKAITTDGGQTWTLVADAQNPNYKSCVQYVPGTQGQEIFAVGKTGVSFSNDAGKTWKEVSKEGHYAIQFVDKNTAWLSGNNRIGKLTLKQ
ncbi:MAG: Ycf48-like protein [Polaribacter sp. SA4-10]|nr:MAG: Ycf48-like protein [Polaribacter sp. SA4-10]